MLGDGIQVVVSKVVKVLLVYLEVQHWCFRLDLAEVVGVCVVQVARLHVSVLLFVTWDDRWVSSSLAVRTLAYWRLVL